MKLSALRTEAEPQWRESGLQDVSFLLTGLKTLTFRRKFEALLGHPSTAKEIKKGGETETAAKDKAFHKAISEKVLKDWKGLTNDDGTPVPFSTELAFQLLQESIPFRDAVTAACREIDDESMATEEDAVGNSPSSSGGTSPGDQSSTSSSTSSTAGTPSSGTSDQTSGQSSPGSGTPSGS